jgi:hypothetical protein
MTVRLVTHLVHRIAEELGVSKNVPPTQVYAQ